MNKTFLTATLVAVVGIAAAQQTPSVKADKYTLEIPKDNIIELQGGVVANSVFRFATKGTMQTADNGIGSTFNILYSRRLSERWWVGGGLGYISLLNTATISTVPPFITKDVTTSMWSIPLHVRFDFSKWLYAKPVITVDFQSQNKKGVNLNNQGGVRFALAVGADIEVWKGLHLGIEPSIGVTSLVPFNRRSEDTYSTHQRFLLYGATLNASYRF